MLMILSIMTIGVSAASDATVYTETETVSAEANESFSYTVSLSGTYDGYSLKINKKQSGLTVTNVSAKSGVNADDLGDCWMLSVLGGLCKASSAKEELATVTVSVDKGAKGGTKKLDFSEIIVTNESGDAATYSKSLASVTVVSKNDGQPSGSQGGVTVPEKPIEKEENEIPAVIAPAPISFNDVNTSDWFYENVRYVVVNKLMNGVAEGQFAPNKTLTRAMLVTVLYRNAGEPAVGIDRVFDDVEGTAYFAKAVSWAKRNGIVNGVTATQFAPNANITREQIAAIMYRYAKYCNYDVSVGENTNILSYEDAENISGYAIAPMQYVVGSGLIKGKTASTLNPRDNATRAEIAAILQRFIEGNK